jgi:4-hydroxybenzoate polyprenyltransferase
MMAAWRSLRPHQWVKNILIFVPVALSGNADNVDAWRLTAIGFLVMCAASSAGYIFNDLIDLPHDRQHRSKRNRPIASGALPRGSAVMMALAGLGLSFGVMTATNQLATLILLAYVVTSLAYSRFLKRIAMLDVFVLASLYTLRIALGVALLEVVVSPWLLIFSMFCFLSLSLAKRYAEIMAAAEAGSTALSGRGYLTSDGNLVLAFGVGASLAAVLVIVLYLIEDAFPRAHYDLPGLLWLQPAIIFLGLCRIWLVTQRNRMLDDPVAFAIKDPVCLGCAAASATALLLALR